jgi:hypothetical protein
MGSPLYDLVPGARQFFLFVIRKPQSFSRKVVDSSKFFEYIFRLFMVFCINFLELPVLHLSQPFLMRSDQRVIIAGLHDEFGVIPGGLNTNLRRIHHGDDLKLSRIVEWAADYDGIS